MPEKNPKIKSIFSLEKTAQEITPAKEEQSPKEKKIREFSLKKLREKGPEAKAEALWSFWQSFKDSWLEYIKEKRESGDSQSLALMDIFDDENPLTQEFKSRLENARILSLLKEMYSDEETRLVYEQGMKKYAEQWASVNGNWPKYQELRNDEDIWEEEEAQLQKKRFEGLRQGREKGAVLEELAIASSAMAENKARQAELLAKNPDLAARAVFSELKELKEQLDGPDHFMWTKSRHKILEAIEDAVASANTLRMVVLEGQSGTGKTTLAKAVAQLFTGEAPIIKEADERMKVDRELLADKNLRGGTDYGPVLYGLTGKKTADQASPEHQGLAVFIDEANKAEDIGTLATLCDRLRSGEPTGYSTNGADPKDLVLSKAIVLGAQNPAGSRFRRTSYTPEIQRKMKMIPVEYFPQSAENPELFETFLVALMDDSNRIQANKAELGPIYNEKHKEENGKNITEEVLDGDPKAGGELWRLAQALSQAYENLYGRDNILSRGNPEALISGSVLTPGDIFLWLKEYRLLAREGKSLKSFLSEKLVEWLETAFTADDYLEDKDLYIKLFAEYGLIAGGGNAKLEPLAGPKISLDIITDKELAQLSPRVPRKAEIKDNTPAAPEYADEFIDYGGKKRVKVSLDKVAAPKGRYVSPDKAGEDLTFTFVGLIKECAKFPELKGKWLVESGKGDREIIDSLDELERLHGNYQFTVFNAKNPYHEAFKEAGIIDQANNPEQQDLEVDLQEILSKDRRAYQEVTFWLDRNMAGHLPENMEDFNLSEEDIELIGSRMELGEIPLFVPGRLAQIKGLKTAIEKLKPRFKKDGQEGQVADTYLWDYIDSLISFMEKIAGKPDMTIKEKDKLKAEIAPFLKAGEDPELLFQAVLSIPESPYISLITPSQSPEERTKNKALGAQKAEFEKIKQEFIDLNEGITLEMVNITSIAEYLILQNRFTDRVLEAKALNDLVPLDDYRRTGGTFSRFIDLPVASDGSVPDGIWFSDASQLVLDGDVVDAHSRSGFRFSVRIPRKI